MMPRPKSSSRRQSFCAEKENLPPYQKDTADTDTITVLPRQMKRALEDGGEGSSSSNSAKMASRVTRRKGNGGREEHQAPAHRDNDDGEAPLKHQDEQEEVLDTITVAARAVLTKYTPRSVPAPLQPPKSPAPGPASPCNGNTNGGNTDTSTPHVLRNGKPRIIIRHNKNKGKGTENKGLGGKIGIIAVPATAEGEEKENLGKETVCVSTLLRKRDFEVMPSLESALKRDAKRRESEPGPVGRKQSKTLTNGYTNGGNGTSSSSSASSITNGKQDSKESKKDKPLERNIDNVIFGDVTFKAWYPSWYPKEIIGDSLRGDGKGIVVPELYVCKRCFGYGKVLVEWVRHCRCCEKGIPGERIYSHGIGRGGHEATWSVWEVDGSVDTLFCQNLSLFAKLFLDNKSVFFDVQGFNYFLLVHTSPPSSSTPGAQQIVGFFSKEKMSWDNNNLACILVFPPWQRKGLGALLMGVSYSIARRENILGGPEKPISELGMKGYKRYWGAEIARWLLEVRESDKKKSRGMVDVLMCSQETWISPEDCLMVLREMGVVEKAGRGKGTVERVRIDKGAVRKWVERMGLSLDRVVYEEGFVEGYAMKDIEGVESGD